MAKLTGQIALVTGAAGGIGQAIVARLRQDGATVIGTDIQGADINGDLTDADFVDGLINQVVKDHGGLHILCNNAGSSPAVISPRKVMRTFNGQWRSTSKRLSAFAVPQSR